MWIKMDQLVVLHVIYRITVLLTFHIITLQYPFLQYIFPTEVLDIVQHLLHDVAAVPEFFC